MEKKKFYITVLNVLSCLGVILLHTSTFWNFSKTRGWVAANCIESVFYFAVPVFVMISGATLIDYGERYTTKEYFVKRIKKTVIPFIAWSIISVFFALYCGSKVSLKPIAIINAVINCQYMSIYYFFLLIFGVYLSIPVIGCIEKGKRKGIFMYVIISTFVVNSILPLISRLSNGGIAHNGNFQVYVCGGYLIYVFIGYYIDNYDISKNVKKLIYLLGILGLLIHFGGTWYFSFKNNTVDTVLKGYTSVPCVLYSAAIFLAIKNVNFDKVPKLFIKVISFFDGQTFGIYLIHMFVIRLMSKWFHIAPQRFVSNVVFAFVVFVLSALVVKGMQKIPFVRRIIP